MTRRSSGDDTGAERTAARQCVLWAVLLAVCVTWGCSRGKGGGGTTVASPGGGTRVAATAITADDLKAAEHVTRGYWEAVIAGKYAEAVSCTEAAGAPEAQRKAIEAQVKSANEKAKPSRIASLGPARQDESRPGIVLVPYQVQAAEPLSGEAVVRKTPPSGAWLISGGI